MVDSGKKFTGYKNTFLDKMVFIDGINSTQHLPQHFGSDLY